MDNETLKNKLPAISQHEILTVEEVSIFLYISSSWVYKNWKLLGGRKIGGSLFFPKTEDLYECIFGERKRVALRLHSDETTVFGAVVQNKEGSSGCRGDKKKELTSPKEIMTSSVTMKTDITFLTLVNKRLDHLQDYATEKYYEDVVYRAKKWVALWGTKFCEEISEEMIFMFLRNRKKVSANTANAEIRSLKATFNHGINKNLITFTPMNNIEFFPIEKRVKYVPPLEDINLVISKASPDDQDYLWVIRETLGRMGEINNLRWDDIDLRLRKVILYTRKKKGGDLTPRTIPMTDQLFNVLSRKYKCRDKTKPWVFWHKYWSKTECRFIEGPYRDRKKIMRSLCNKAGVKYFRYHPLRHSGASTMDSENVPIGSIQRILGHEKRSTTEIYLHRNAMQLRNMNRPEKSPTQSPTRNKKSPSSINLERLCKQLKTLRILMARLARFERATP